MRGWALRLSSEEQKSFTTLYFHFMNLLFLHRDKF